jgi:A/G-specific adenine glycosylase
VLKPRFGKSPLEDRKGFRDALVGWFAKHGKDYPWRRTREPYEVLVSEVMLQQTQIATVLGKGYFTRFLESFPDVRTLAVADDASLLKAWEGLGYYRRVRMLRETARAVIAHHGGCFPHDAGELMQLPGIGRYTVGALRAFAFGLPAVLVDGNVARVIARLMDCQDPVDETAGQKLIWDRAGVLADDKRPRAYHAALMELGQTICRPTNPDCINCPVSVFCKTKNPGMLPVKRRKTIITGLDEHAVWLRDPQGRLLLHHESGKRRTGLWKLPLRESGEVSHLPMIAEHLYSITRFRVTLRVYDAAALRKPFILAPGDTWIDLHEVESLAMAAPFRKVTRQLLQDF